jgi:hypothetical protein
MSATRYRIYDSRALAALAPYLPPEKLCDVLATIGTIANVEARAEGIVRLAPYLEADQTDKALDELVMTSQREGTPLAGGRPYAAALASVSLEKREAILKVHYANRIKWSDFRPEKPTSSDFEKWANKNFPEAYRRGDPHAAELKRQHTRARYHNS